MSFPSKVERWRPIVQAELDRIAVPIPPELPLSLIRWESGGQPGIVNPTSGASGLGQFLPIAVKEYNRFHSQKLTMADMRAKTDRGALLQIRATVWLIAHNWRLVNKYLRSRGLTQIPIDQLVKIADLYYGAGPGTTREHLDRVDPPTYEAAEANDPNFWAFGHANKVWRLADENGAVYNLPKIDRWLGAGGTILDPDPDLPDDDIPDDSDNQTGTDLSALIAVLIIAIGWYLLKQGNK